MVVAKDASFKPVMETSINAVIISVWNAGLNAVCAAATCVTAAQCFTCATVTTAAAMTMLITVIGIHFRMSEMELPEHSV